MTDHTTSERVRELEEELAALRAKLEKEQRAPKPGPPKDGKIWATRFPDHPALWLEDGRNVRLSDGKYSGCTDFIGSFHTSYTVPLADLRAVVEAHDPANGEAPPRYAEAIACWRARKKISHLLAFGAPDWLNATGATKDRSKFPPLEPDCQFWRKADGKIVLPDGGSDGGADGRYLWPKSQSAVMVIAKHNRDYDGDEGPDHALVEYLGRAR